MSPFEEETSSTIKRESIIEKNRFLQAFIGYPTSKTTLGTFHSKEYLDSSEESARLLEEIEAKYGPNWQLLTIYSIYTTALSLEGTNPDLTDEKNMSNILSLILVGYEVGNAEDLKVVQSDIELAAIKEGFFKTTTQSNSEEFKKRVAFMRRLLALGILLKEGLKSPEKSSSDVFRKFIEGLDF